MTDKTDKNAQAVLDFWFKECEPKQHFQKDDAFDAMIKARFHQTYLDIVADVEPWLQSPKTALAAIIVLDQFTRNMFRGQAEAFMADPIAVRIARHVIDENWIDEISDDRCSFVLMPFMHSEERAVHEWALPIFEKYAGEGTICFEHKHKAIIDQFGRYPHRNAILGRESTAEELEFLKDNPGF